MVSLKDGLRGSLEHPLQGHNRWNKHGRLESKLALKFTHKWSVILLFMIRSGRVISLAGREFLSLTRRAK